MPHCGIAIDDPRNAGVIAYFTPKPRTGASILRALVAASGRTAPAVLQSRVESVMEAMRRGPRKTPPISQSLKDIADPWFGLDTHPEIIAELWILDDLLPQSCRWVLWGRPSLVHAETGVVFAVGFGTVGMVLRLPPQVIEIADPKQASVARAGNPGQSFDIGAAGPQWRFVAPGAPKLDWCRAAYGFAG
jgi:hypothetical protein